MQKVFVAPGNAGTAREPGVENVAITDLAALADFAAREQIELTVVGPEAPLAAGVVDLFRARGLRIFGPTQAAAQLESSKDFAKSFMVAPRHPDRRVRDLHRRARRRTPTSTRRARRSWSRPTGSPPARASWSRRPSAEAHAAVDAMLVEQPMGDAGARVVIEEFLDGEEASFIVMVDGEHMPAARDQPGSQAAAATATRARTPAAWARTRRRRS